MRKNFLPVLFALIVLAAATIACGGSGSGATQQEQTTYTQITMANDCGIVKIGKAVWYTDVGCGYIPEGLYAGDDVPNIYVWDANGKTTSLLQALGLGKEVCSCGD